jgi:hypothetical protein
VKYASASGLLLCAILGAFSASAQSVLGMMPSLDSISSRLELTPEQEAQLQPVFANRQLELQQSQLELQQASTSQQKRDVLRHSKEAGEAFSSQVESVLTPSQKNEWREIRAELREKAKERIEEKSSSE